MHGQTDKRLRRQEGSGRRTELGERMLMMLVMPARLCWKSSNAWEKKQGVEETRRAWPTRKEFGELMLMMLMMLALCAGNLPMRWSTKQVWRRQEGLCRRKLLLMMLARLCWKSSNAWGNRQGIEAGELMLMMLMLLARLWSKSSNAWGNRQGFEETRNGLADARSWVS